MHPSGLRGDIMPGSGIVNRNLALAMAAKLKLAEASMDLHIKNSQSYARSSGPWQDRTGAAREGLSSKTDVGATEIKSSVFHTAPYGYWLEKRSDFHGRYRILQEARSNNLAMLWAALRRIFR